MANTTRLLNNSTAGSAIIVSVDSYSKDSLQLDIRQIGYNGDTGNPTSDHVELTKKQWEELVSIVREHQSAQQ